MMGSALIAMIGGLHHWWPKMSGRMFSERWGKIAFWLVFIGFNVTFFTQFMLGSQGMPRRYYDYLPMYQPYHVISTIGSYVMAVGFVIIAVYLLHSCYRGRKAPSNPWGGRSLEWECASPPPYYNFKTTPTVGDCYDFSGVRWDPAQDGYVIDRELEARARAAGGGH